MKNLKPYFDYLYGIVYRKLFDKMENNSDNKIESNTNVSENTTPKVDITKLKRIEKGSPYSYETYEMLVDEDGNEYHLDGRPVKKRPKDLDKDTLQKMLDSGELKIVSYFNIAHSDIFDIYIHTNGNKYTLNGMGML
jgi:hypothetical protein